MKASVIMPSYLGNYEGCASDRENKFIRAVNSFLENDYQYSELIVISDFCKITSRLLKDNFLNELYSGKIKHVELTKKQPLFSGNLRSSGIKICTGNIVMYLDTDDIIGKNHISCVMEQMQSEDYDWCFYNDYIRTDSGLLPKSVELQHGSIGTSSIAHRNVPKLNWDGCDGYGHDYKFVTRLMDWSENYGKIYGATYIICHIPNQIDN
jgi:glycosyltransferase involved in cell wall biosynthesis